MILLLNTVPVERQAANIMEPEIIQAIAGFTSAMIFASSKIPMLVKAFKTKDLGSYSLGHIVLSNTGNLMYWLYVISLPVGPIWFLQVFFTIADMLMLFCYIRYQNVR
jgi:uncharacterized protein with PQ loop repeat